MKLVVEEPGSAEAEALWNVADAVACSLLGRIEGHAALARARRASRLDARGLVRARRLFERHWQGCREVAVTSAVIESAVALTHRYGLRGYDSVHLASALALGTTRIVFTTWDVDLRRAAATEGLPIAPLRI